MAITEVDICNGALTKLGAERILTLDDNNPRARLVKESYPKQRDILLYSHPWDFNRAYSELGAITLPTGVFDYKYAFQIPSDCHRVFEVNSPGVSWEVVEGEVLLSNTSTMKIKYGKKIIDANKFSSTFVECVEYAVASDICYSLTQSTDQMKTMKAMLENQLRQTRSFNAQVGTPQQVTATKWLNARRSWR